MGNYSIVIQDSILLDSLKGKKSTLIVGCAGCANVSTAYEKNLPVFKVEVEEKTGNRTMTPYAIRSEAERLKRLLEANKIKAEIVVNGNGVACEPRIKNSPGSWDFLLTSRTAPSTPSSCLPASRA